jgi:hypothetical protein
VAVDVHSRSDVIRALPTFSAAADLIGIDPSGITRLVKRLGIEPQMWGKREKRLTVADLLTLAIHAQRASLEEVAGGLTELTEREHPDQVEYITEEIDRYFDALPEMKASDPDEFVADLHASLPKEWAETAEAIYRRFAGNS